MGLLLVGALPPPTGGVATHVNDLRAALFRTGVQISVVDPRDHLGLVRALATARARGDLVHLHTNGHNPRSWTLAALCTMARPSVLTLHSGLAPEFMRAHRLRVRAICRRYDAIVAVSPPIAAALDDCGVPSERVTVAPAFTPCRSALKLRPPGVARARALHAPLLAATVVPAQPEYGADVLLDAFALVRARLPSAGLLVYGPGTRDPSWFGEIARRDLQRSIHLLGELDRARSLGTIAAADLFVRPTRADGDAVSVREALALGRPVVASAVGQRPSGTILFPAGDPGACAEMIFHALGNGGQPAVIPSAPESDCLPTLFAIYGRWGVETSGTALASSG